MATLTYYLQNAAPPYTPTTKRGAWDDATATNSKGLGDKAGGAAWQYPAVLAPTTADYDLLIVRFVGSPLAADTLFSGAVEGVIGFREGNVGLNAQLHLHVFVLQGQTDTLRGTLLADYIDPDEASDSYTTAGEGFSGTGSEVQAYAGDTPVVEVGARYNSIAADLWRAYVCAGTTNATDLTDGGDPQTYPGWIRLSYGGPPVAQITAEAPAPDGISVSPQAVVAEATASAPAPSESDAIPSAEASADAPAPEGVHVTPAPPVAEATADAPVPIGVTSHATAPLAEATAMAPVPIGAGTTINKRRVWQASAGSAESYSDDRPCTPGISYRVKVDIKAAGTTGTRGVKIRWIKADGSTTDSAVTNLATEDGAFHEVDTGPIVALGTRMRIVLVTSGTTATTQFDDVRLYEVGPNTGYTADCSMDNREAAIPFDDGALEKYGVWTQGGGPPPEYLESTGVGDYVGRVVNGQFVTVEWKAAGAGALAKVRINGVQYQQSGSLLIPGTSNINVAADLSLTCVGLDPANDHIVEVEVAAVKTRFSRFVVSTANLISTRWDYITVWEALGSLRKAVGGELAFDAIAKTVTHVATVGQDLKANNILEFRRGSNLTEFGENKDRFKIVNSLTGLGYGEGEYQLVVIVDGTDTNDDEETSTEKHGVRRGTYTNKECKSRAALTAECLLAVAETEWPVLSYTVKCTDEAAALCSPGDTGHFVYKGRNLNLRILEIQRSTESAEATLIVGNKVSDYFDRVEATRKQLSTLNRSFQGVPTDNNLPLAGEFDYYNPVECPFFIPYGADLIDLRLRYQIRGMRATATAVGGGGGTNTPSGGGSTTVSGGGGSSGAGGYTTPTSSSPSSNTSGAGAASVGGGPSANLYSSSPRDETTPYAFNNETGPSAPDNPHIHGLHQHVHSIDWPYIHNTTVASARAEWQGHTHTLAGHTHTVTVPNHYHSTPNHQHSTPAHQHTLPDHVHTISYGIEESAIPATVRLYLDDVLITALNDATYVSDFDLRPYIALDSNGRVREGYHVIKVATATVGATGGVTGIVFASKFISTEAA